MEYWHSLDLKKIFDILDTNKKGLTTNEAKERLKKYGKNSIETESKISKWKILIDQFRSPLIILLIFSVIILISVDLYIGEFNHLVDSILILTIVILNAAFGFIQNYKAEESIQALKKMMVLKTTVIRNGRKIEINIENLVPGDIIFLEQGKKVPADLRIIESNNLAIDESILTGESTDVTKKPENLDENILVNERTNMCYMNTTVTRGNTLCVVVATNLKTEVGKIVKQIQTTEKRKTPFQGEMKNLGTKIGIIIGIIIFITFLTQLLTSDLSFVQTLITSIALAVAAIPEGLPAVVTLALAFGTKKMARKNSLIRKLPVVESLGSVDVICTDKTKTITEGKMSVEKIFAGNEVYDITDKETKKFRNLFLTGLLCNNSTEKIGDPTEIALIKSAEKLGMDKEKLDLEYKKIDEIPFSSERKAMTTVHKKGGKKHVFTKGAPEIVIEMCSHYLVNGKKKKLTHEMKKLILHQNAVFASQALRVLCFAYSNKGIEKDMTFLGLQAMIDPPRKEVKDAIKSCRDAGIRVIMITGDNLLTAKAIAKEVGLNSVAKEGKEINHMSDNELEKLVRHIDVFARVMPEHKQRILKALQANGHIVAMTGDGVNDAPALKAADVGISMGVRGTDVAKEVADMILLDDNFATIVTAVKEGRTIFDNIRKFVNYLLTSNFAEVGVVFIASLFGYLPITAVQILWINLLTDGMPALALGVDPAMKNIMKRKPKPKNENVINDKLGKLIITVGSTETVLILCTFFIALAIWGQNTAVTMTFTAFVVYELVKVQIIRSQEHLHFFSNKWLVGALSSSLALQALVLYTPLSNYFDVVPLGIPHWALIIGMISMGWILANFITKSVIHYEN